MIKNFNLNKFTINKDLLYQLSLREIRIRYIGSNLGQIWSLINPLLSLGLYLIIFGFIFQGRFNVIKNENYFDFALELFVSITIFNIISESINSAPFIIQTQPNYVKKIVFPLEILSIVKLTPLIYYSLYNFILIIFLIPFSNCHLSGFVLYIPIIIFPVILISLGVSWILSAIAVYYRDICHLTGFLSTSLMYGSAIVYSPNRLPKQIFNILKFNPILIIVDQIRSTVLWGQNINFKDILYVYECSFGIFLVGWYIFKKLRAYFSDVI